MTNEEKLNIMEAIDSFFMDDDDNTNEDKIDINEENYDEIIRQIHYGILQIY